MYINEDQRNVHVWCTKVTNSPGTGKKCLGLIGGIFAPAINEPGVNQVPIKLFYEWIELIIVRTSPNFLLAKGPDPREELIRAPGGQLTLQLLKRKGGQNGTLLDKNSESPLSEGHYFMFDNTNGWELITVVSMLDLDVCTPTWPELRQFNKFIKVVPKGSTVESVQGSARLSPRTGGNSNSPLLNTGTPFTIVMTPLTTEITRRPEFRDEVRNRDRKCVLTGQVPPGQSTLRLQYTIFQAAHVYPFGAVIKATFPVDLEDKARQILFDLSKADGLPNGILLTSKAHLQYDRFQWGVWVERLWKKTRSTGEGICPTLGGCKLHFIE
ncbi:hypothetical protein CPB84DRAFT_1883247 [Gymnopilus junonius]|uniref:HNH nuclease domain-containing protein n=1 Tax=Gymnopilus junonius TaxID=109634 RepID=A0A9P5TGV3_GYMJU|nr:hypothetical protein CPB84DRAFT_1883247 [Gymnopilus junonius]